MPPFALHRRKELLKLFENRRRSGAKPGQREAVAWWRFRRHARKSRATCEKLVVAPGGQPAAGRVADRPEKGGGVIDGIRTRNNQNHNLGLYH